MTARTEKGKLIYLINPHSRIELMNLRRRHRFYCPDCGSTVLLKIGDIKIPHFAHKSLSSCGSGEPESSLHLEGKILLHQFFIDKNIPADMETYIPEIRQRADVFVDRKSVIEFQCSPIASSEVSRRSAAYAHQGLHFTWIGGIKESHENKIQVLNIKEYQKEMLLEKDHSRYLLLLNPATKQFQYFSNLFHINGSRWVGKVASLPVKMQSYPFAVPKQLSRKEFESVCTVFAKSRNDYINAQFYARKRYQNDFWILCYELGLDMRGLPKKVGVPIMGADCLMEHAVIWQLALIRAQRLGISNAGILSSDIIKIRNQHRTAQALKVLDDYAEFLKQMEAVEETSVNQREVLYDIYCKSVRKLRK